ncbi:hypothetical protein [Candidatus Nitrospira nitrificans]|nr:hypothetical protein [Candidatus Nitrospira nitrificans]
MNRPDGFPAPKGLMSGGPPNIPGKPRPAKPVVLPREAKLGATRLVVAGVIISAEMPPVCGAPIGGTGEITAGTCCDCWMGSPSGASWADPIDCPPSKLKQIAANIGPNNCGIGGRVGGVGDGRGSGTGGGGKGLGSGGMGPGSGFGFGPGRSLLYLVFTAISKHDHG